MGVVKGWGDGGALAGQWRGRGLCGVNRVRGGIGNLNDTMYDQTRRVSLQNSRGWLELSLTGLMRWARIRVFGEQAVF